MLNRQIYSFICFILSAFTLPIFSLENPQEIEYSYEERSMMFDLLFPEEQKEIDISSLKGFDLIQKDKIPYHLFLTMDGNRRWAKKRGLPSTEGHWEGAKTAKRIIKCAAQLGIKIVTVSCFSKLNSTDRPAEEIENMVKILTQALNEEKPDFLMKQVRVKIIGDLSILPLHIQEGLKKLAEQTSSNSDFTLVLAINYSGRDEITRAFVKIADDLDSGIIHKKDISSHLIESYLDTAGLPPVDLFIRTSGEHFLGGAWHLYYTECFFPPVLWPDFREQDLINVILEYQKMERLFGS